MTADHTSHPMLRRALLAGGVGAGLGVAGAVPALASGRPRGVADLAEHKEVETVVLTERWARDAAQWEVMRDQFHSDSVVDISWIKASGSQFVDLSQRSFDAGGRSCHVLSPVLVDVRGDRATADTGVVIAGRSAIGGVPVFLTAYSRIVERLERRRGRWAISHMTCIYQFDYLTPENPDQRVDLDPDRLAGYRQSYAALSYWVEETQGPDAVRDSLPGVDRPETMHRLYRDNEAWLGQGSRSRG